MKHLETRSKGKYALILRDMECAALPNKQFNNDTCSKLEVVFAWVVLAAV